MECWSDSWLRYGWQKVMSVNAQDVIGWCTHCPWGLGQSSASSFVLLNSLCWCQSQESWEESTVSIPRNVYKTEKTSLQKWPLVSCPTVIVILFSFTCSPIALPVGLRWIDTCHVCRLVKQFLWIIVVASVYAGNLLTPSLGAMWSLLSCCSIRGENHCL